MSDEPQTPPSEPESDHSPNPANNPPPEIVHEPVTTGLETPDPEPAEGTETEQAPRGPVDPEPAEGAQQTPYPDGPPVDSEGNSE